MSQNIGDRIKEARESLRLTQEELAKKLNISRQAVSSFERYTKRVPRNIEEIAFALNVDKNFLLTGLTLTTKSFDPQKNKLVAKIRYSELINLCTIASLIHGIENCEDKLEVQVDEERIENLDRLFVVELPHIDAMIKPTGHQYNLYKGDVAIFEAGATPANEKFVLVRHDGQVIVRQYFVDGAQVVLKALNESVYPSILANSETEVLAVLKDLRKKMP